jgi:hypothetical protein
VTKALWVLWITGMGVLVRNVLSVGGERDVKTNTKKR